MAEEIRQSVVTAATSLRGMGVQVEESSVPLAANAGAISGAIRVVEASVTYGELLRDRPIGLQIAGRPFDESTVFRAGDAYEQQTDWHTRRPNI